MAAEITFRVLVLSTILAIVLGAANVYLGLFAGLTVSASIPAAIISMSILRTIYGNNVSILENNLVQTAASAGESLAAGVIFTFPALVIMNDSDDDLDLKGWTHFKYLETVVLAICGGVMGIMFSIPIRRALLIDIQPPLAFPEGVACANVLLAGEAGGSSAALVAKAASVGGLLKLFQSTNLAVDTLGFGGIVRKAVFRLESNISAALLGVGYIIGWKISIVFLLGGLTNWMIAIPIGTATEAIKFGDDHPGPLEASYIAWSQHTRYLGVGAMLVGGVYALISLRVALWKGIEAGIKAFRVAATHGHEHIPPHEQDIPLHICFGILLCCLIPFYILVSLFMDDWLYTLLLSFFVTVFGFFASAVAAYMAGLVGSSNNPISGVTVCVVLVTASVLRLYLGTDGIGPPTTIYVSSMIATAGAISGDNMQDLKTGQMIKATPWKQQVMLILGVIVSSLAMPPILNLLNEAYGFGPNGLLPAPQASLMLSVSKGVILGGLPWGWVAIGGSVALLVIGIDGLLKHYSIPFAMPVLGFAVGFYLPLATGVPIMIGAIISAVAEGSHPNEASSGVLYAGGLITGEALMGIILAIPIAISGNTNVLHILHEPTWYLSIPLMVGISLLLYKAGKISSQPISQYNLSQNNEEVKGVEDIETEMTSTGSDESLLPEPSSSSDKKKKEEEESNNHEFSPLHITNTSS